MEYRQLTQTEIEVLENNVCWAEDWDRVQVAEGFKPYNFHRVIFYGDIRLGEFNKQVEVTKGFFKHSGINDTTLRNVTVGNDCLIEKVGNYINNYTIGNDCYIANICTLETTDDATFGEGSVISVLNEMGDGNVTIFRELNSQLASFMVKHYNDKGLRQTLQQMIEDELRVNRPDRGYIGNNVKIINAKDIMNTIIKGDCEISGAARLSECTVMSSMDAPVFIGTGVICENSIICDGCSINNSVKMQDCFVGEACQITNGSRLRPVCSSPTRSWPTVRPVLPSADLSVPRIIRARCSSVVSSRSIMPVRTRTSRTTPIRWARCTGERWSVVRRQPLVPIS